MRRSLYAFAAAAAFVLASAGISEARPFTARDMVMMDRVSDPHISPDGRYVAYDLRTTELEANKGAHAIWVRELGKPDATPYRLAVSDKGATSPRWSSDGHIYFLSSRSGSEQVWRTDAKGEAAEQVTDLPLDVESFRLSPGGDRIVVGLAVFPDCADLACTKARLDKQAKGKPSGQLYDRLFVRHWDEWADGTKNHLVSLKLDGGKASGAPVDLMKGQDADTPTKPYGDDSDFGFTPDGANVVYSTRIAGRTEPWSTDFDLWEVPADGSAAPKRLTGDNPAWDAQPVVSPDGRWVAWRAQKRPGFESDRFGIWLMDLKIGFSHEVDPTWDRSAQSLAWSPDGKTLYTTADDVGQTRLFAIDAETGAVRPLTGPGHVSAFDVGPKGEIVFVHDQLDAPGQLYELTEHAVLRSGLAAPPPPQAVSTVQLTSHNAARLKDLQFGAYEQFEFPGWNGETVHGYVVKPAGYVAGKKYPVAFLIHGGPQGSFGNLFHYRWNAETYAGQGFAVVMIDFHGSTGYGQAFTDSISRHWGDRPLEDLQKGWAAALAKYPFLDGNRACALGGSYGGFMVNWIAGVWNQPWKCLVSHDGVFDARMMGYASEEEWFETWEQGGMPWEVPQNYEEFNPADHVGAWTKPQLIIHGQKDYRIPVEQGIGAFTALQGRKVDSQFLYFPDENHWVLKPQNSLQWHDTVEAWLKKWTAQP